MLTRGDIHPRHRCQYCGCPWEYHKGGVDHNGPIGLCPPVRTYGSAVSLTLVGLETDQEIDSYLADYWSGKTQFRPC
jgi:hypothetical protein